MNTKAQKECKGCVAELPVREIQLLGKTVSTHYNPKTNQFIAICENTAVSYKHIQTL